MGMYSGDETLGDGDGVFGHPDDQATPAVPLVTRCDRCKAVAQDYIYVYRDKPRLQVRLCLDCYGTNTDLPSGSHALRVFECVAIEARRPVPGLKSRPKQAGVPNDEAMVFSKLDLPRRAWCANCGSSSTKYAVPVDGDKAGDMLCFKCFESISPDCSSLSTYTHADASKILNGNLESAANDLLREAQLLRCLATSPRFRSMTVSEALLELKDNGMAHDGGKAVEKAISRRIVFGAKGGVQ